MNALIAGATGLVGQALVGLWTGPGSLHLLARRPLRPRHSSHRVLVVDFAALPRLPAADWAFCCLGTTIKQAGSQAAFRAVDFDAVLAFAHAAQAAGVQRLGLVSALGADAHSSNFYSRIKGEAEIAVRQLGFATLVIARPSLLVGDRAALGQPTRWGEKVAIAATGPLSGFIPKVWRPISAERVARSLLRSVAAGPAGLTVLHSARMQDLGTH